MLEEPQADYLGDAILPSGTTELTKVGQAKVIRGTPWGKHEVTDQVAVSLAD